ncbi:MAG: DoxX family protein [Pseudomonadota bacterium]
MTTLINESPTQRGHSVISPESGTLILRVSLGSVLLAHSVYLKLMIFTLPGTAAFFTSIGLPGILAYAVFAIEAIAGIALILGIKTRLFSALVIPVLLGATWAHSSSGWLFTNAGGGWEYPLILAVMAIAQVGLGDGKYALSSFKSD